MKKVCIFLAPGFEEVEALTPVDLLRRAGAEVTVVSIGEERVVTGSHQIPVTADAVFDEMDFSEQDLFILPGGQPGTNNLKACGKLRELLAKAACGYLRSPYGIWRYGAFKRKKGYLLSKLRGRAYGSRIPDRPGGDRRKYHNQPGRGNGDSFWTVSD